MSLKTANLTNVVLVGLNAKELPRVDTLPMVEIQNLGPNAIWIALAHKNRCTVGNCRRLGTGEAMRFSVDAVISVWARAETAAQVAGAGTIVTHTAV